MALPSPVAQAILVHPVKLPHLTFATAALAVAIFLLPGAGESLAWDRNDTGTVFWANALTAHLTHWDPAHLLFDLLAWMVLGTIIETHSRRLWCWTVGLSVPLVFLFVLLAAPDISVYRGLSGLDSALFTAAALMIHDRAIKRNDPGMAWITVGCIMALVSKIVWEWSTGSPVFARSGNFTAVPQAHLAGALAGWIVFQVTRRMPAQGTESRPLARFMSQRHDPG
jgi:rhomboid family GlyGly-CTERM serine protease